MEKKTVYEKLLAAHDILVDAGMDSQEAMRLLIKEIIDRGEKI